MTLFATIPCQIRPLQTSGLRDDCVLKGEQGSGWKSAEDSCLRSDRGTQMVRSTCKCAEVSEKEMWAVCSDLPACTVPRGCQALLLHVKLDHFTTAILIGSQRAPAGAGASRSAAPAWILRLQSAWETWKDAQAHKVNPRFLPARRHRSRTSVNLNRCSRHPSMHHCNCKAPGTLRFQDAGRSQVVLLCLRAQLQSTFQLSPTHPPWSEGASAAPMPAV